MLVSDSFDGDHISKKKKTLNFFVFPDFFAQWLKKKRESLEDGLADSLAHFRRGISRLSNRNVHSPLVVWSATKKENLCLGLWCKGQSTESYGHFLPWPKSGFSLPDAGFQRVSYYLLQLTEIFQISRIFKKKQPPV